MNALEQIETLRKHLNGLDARIRAIEDGRLDVPRILAMGARQYGKITIEIVLKGSDVRFRLSRAADGERIYESHDMMETLKEAGLMAF